MFLSLVSPFSGIIRAETFLLWRASQQSFRATALSSPPDTPKVAFVEWLLLKKFFISSRS